MKRDGDKRMICRTYCTCNLKRRELPLDIVVLVVDTLLYDGIMTMHIFLLFSQVFITFASL